MLGLVSQVLKELREKEVKLDKPEIVVLNNNLKKQIL